MNNTNTIKHVLETNIVYHNLNAKSLNWHDFVRFKKYTAHTLKLIYNFKKGYKIYEKKLFMFYDG